MTGSVDEGRMASGRQTWLCRDEHARERLLDMDRRMKRARAGVLLVLVGMLVLAAPWEGWWTLAALVPAFGGYAVSTRLAPRTSCPECVIAGAWLLSALTIAVAVAMTGGPLSPAVAWFMMLLPGLAARFDRRGLAAGLAVLIALILAVTVGVNPGAVLARPTLIIFPLALLAALSILTLPLLASDIQHRDESVLDGLTGMLNRRSLAARVNELEQQAALTGQPVGVILGDLDHFKEVNDTHGHQIGDAVLVDVAYAMRKELRAFDLAYRLGGEEFLVLLPGATLDDAALLAERLRLAVARAKPAGLPVTMSLGVASAQGIAVRHNALLADADIALYHAKRAGRNRVDSATRAADTAAGGVALPAPSAGSKTTAASAIGP